MGITFDGFVYYGYPFTDDERERVLETYDSLEDAFEDIKVPRENYDFSYVEDPDGPFAYSHKVVNKPERERYWADKKQLWKSVNPVRFGYAGYLGGESQEYLYIVEFASYWGDMVRLDLPEATSEDIAPHVNKLRYIVGSIGLNFDETRLDWYLTSTYIG
jgi:hypothetical protein